MIERTSQATWKGNLKQGSGTLRLQSGLYEGPYTFATRFESAKGTNPEELISAAHAACYSMALSHMLSEGGHVPDYVRTEAKVVLDRVESGFRITGITLNVVAKVPGIDEAGFMALAQKAKVGCPVSQALAATNITLAARLEK